MTYHVDEKGKETVSYEAPDLICSGCHKPITGPYMTFSDLHWHKECHPLRQVYVKTAVTEVSENTATLSFPLTASTAPGRKDDSEKLRWDLLPWGPVSEVVSVLTYGAKKYAPDNWKHVPNPRSRYFAAALRHLVAWQCGELRDPESRRLHLAHAVCCLLFCIWFDGTPAEKPGPGPLPEAQP